MTPLRGNVETRLRKLDEGQVDATILALAGMKRLGLTEHATRIMSAEEFLPAVGQGAIGIEARADDARVREALARIDHADTFDRGRLRARVPRRARRLLQDADRRPCDVSGDAVEFRGLIARPDGAAAHDIAGHGYAKDAVTIGTEAGRELKHRAGPGFFD